MKFLSAAIAAIALLCSIQVYAADPPPDDVPSSITFASALPTSGTNIEPSAKYAELAEIAIARLRRDYPAAEFKAVVNYNETVSAVDKPEKERLLIISQVSAPMVVAWRSNCSVNSQFSVREETTLTLLDSEASENRPYESVVQNHWLSDVCSQWTLMNHAWHDQEAAIPKTYVARRFGMNVLDISYDKQEVDRYNKAVASLSKARGERQIAKR